MKQCETCELRAFKEKLLACQVAELRSALKEALMNTPIIGKHIKPYECPCYLLEYVRGDDP